MRSVFDILQAPCEACVGCERHAAWARGGAGGDIGDNGLEGVDVRFVQGDLLISDAEAIVNAVNCVGVMGRGLALQFKRTFPANFKAYAAACKRGEVEPGRMFVFETGASVGPRYIINFPTKRHWRFRSRLDDIDAGLEALVGELEARGVRSVAVPPLGCGLGGLSWPDVRARIEAHLGGLEGVDVRIHEPGGGPGA